MTLASLWQAASVVAQDVFPFSTTMDDNIAQADPLAPDPRIEGAAEDRSSIPTSRR
jgi:ABC-type multidrug transport system fused ATPase/permease subunit